LFFSAVVSFACPWELRHRCLIRCSLGSSNLHPKLEVDTFSRENRRVTDRHHATGSSLAIVRILGIRCGLIITKLGIFRWIFISYINREICKIRISLFQLPVLRILAQSKIPSHYNNKILVNTSNLYCFCRRKYCSYIYVYLLRHNEFRN